MESPADKEKLMWDKKQEHMVLALGCIALVEGQEFDEAYEEKLDELRSYTEDRLKSKQSEQYA
jgi:hypothetical protein